MSPQKTVTVYSKPTGCQQCIAMKRSLNKTDIAYVIADATTAENIALTKGLGHMQAPVTVVRDEAGNVIDSFDGFRPDKVDELKADPLVVRVSADERIAA